MCNKEVDADSNILTALPYLPLSKYCYPEVQSARVIDDKPALSKMHIHLFLNMPSSNNNIISSD